MNLETLLRAAAAGDERAWVCLADRVSPRLRRYFASRCPDLDDKDLAQDTLIVMWQRLPQFELRSEAAFVSWVLTIAQYVALMALRQWRKTAKVNTALGKAERTPSTRVTSLIDRTELIAMVLREIDKLPAGQRRAVENMLDGRDARELAEQQGIGWSSARSAQSRGLAKLRNILHPRTPSS